MLTIMTNALSDLGVVSFCKLVIFIYLCV